MASRKNYTTPAEILQLTGDTVTEDQISQAEDMIDQYVGFADKHFGGDLIGRVDVPSANGFKLSVDHAESYNSGTFIGKYVEIIGGLGMGQRKAIKESFRGGLIVLEEDWDTVPDATSVYHVWQPGKFPRRQDVRTFEDVEYPGIPNAVKLAVAYQAKYIDENEDGFDGEVMQSENIGGYSYSRATGGAIARLIAPRAKTALKGYVRRVGQFK